MLETVFTWSFLTALLSSGVRMAMPLLYAGIGETVSEKSGIVNIGMEGVMLSGAFFAYVGMVFTGSAGAGIAAGILGGMLISMLLALVCVKGKQNQTVCGLALNTLALGITGFGYKMMCNAGVSGQVGIIKVVPIPLLSKIPVIGEAFFTQDILTYAAYILSILCFVFYRYTRTGLSMASIGENPMAADAASIPVEKHQMIACAVNGIMGGMGGAYLIVAQVGLFSDNMTAGRGYIALAAVILGRYNPFGVVLASLLFGVANAAQIRFQLLGTGIPMQIFAMLPYVITLLALLLTSGKSREPKALGTPYIRGKR